MAATVTVKETVVCGNKRIVFATVLLDNNYQTGGYALTAANFGMGAFTFLIPIYLGADYVQSTTKLKMRNSQGMEIGSGVDLSAITMSIIAIGS